MCVAKQLTVFLLLTGRNPASAGSLPSLHEPGRLPSAGVIAVIDQGGVLCAHRGGRGRSHDECSRTVAAQAASAEAPRGVLGGTSDDAGLDLGDSRTAEARMKGGARSCSKPRGSRAAATADGDIDVGTGTFRPFVPCRRERAARAPCYSRCLRWNIVLDTHGFVLRCSLRGVPSSSALAQPGGFRAAPPGFQVAHA